jgi:hypothetical protein
MTTLDRHRNLFLFRSMPELPPKPHGIIWPLSRASEVGQVVRVRCGYCRGKRYYLPEDLQRLFGDSDVNTLSRRMRCEACGKKEISAEVFIPVASERARMTIRRLVDVKVRRVPVWRDEGG